MLGTPPHSPPSHSPPAKVEVENFVLRVAAEFSSRKEQLIFLINNYDMMLGVLMVTNMPPPPPKAQGPSPNLKGGLKTPCVVPPPHLTPRSGRWRRAKRWRASSSYFLPAPR